MYQERVAAACIRSRRPGQRFHTGHRSAAAPYAGPGNRSILENAYTVAWRRIPKRRTAATSIARRHHRAAIRARPSEPCGAWSRPSETCANGHDAKAMGCLRRRLSPDVWPICNNGATQCYYRPFSPEMIVSSEFRCICFIFFLAQQYFF